MVTQRQPLQNVAWLVGERLGRALVTALVLGAVARYLEPSGFGRLNFAITTVIVFGYLANLGLEGLVVNELVRRPTETGAVLGTACLLRLVGGIVVFGLLAAVVTVWPLPDAPLVVVAGLGLLLQPVEVIDLWFQRHLDSRRTVVARTVGIFAGSTLKLCLVASGAPLIAFAWAQVADAAFVAVCLGLAGWRAPHTTGPWQWDGTIARILLQRGGVLALSSLAVSFAMRLDQLLVRQFLGEHAAGEYFAATRLTDIALFAGATLTLSLFPGLAAAHAQSDAVFRQRLQSLYDLLSAFGWAIAVGCTLLGWLVVGIIYGPDYVTTIRILPILGWASLIALNASARWQLILLAAPPALNLWSALFHACTVASLAWWLLPRFGVVGAALALVAACVVSGLLTSWLFPALRPYAGLQLRGLSIAFTPRRWPGLLRDLRS